jgi:hypothetical protein
MFTTIQKILATSILLTALTAGCTHQSDFDLNLIATGILDDSLLEKINYQKLTAEEYAEIQQKIGEVLRVDPNNFSVNLLQFELEKKIAH